MQCFAAQGRVRASFMILGICEGTIPMGKSQGLQIPKELDIPTGSKMESGKDQWQPQPWPQLPESKSDSSGKRPSSNVFVTY